MPKFSTIPFDAYTVSGIQQSDVKYPLTLQINANGISRYFIQKLEKTKDFEADYILKAIAAGTTTSSDEAIKVTYEAQINLILCEDKERRFSDVVHLPADPFLGLWFVPEEKRVTQFNEAIKENQQITPCATSDFIYDHDPYFYWYYWALDHKQCRENLTAGSFLEFPVENKKPVSLETKEPFDLSFLRKVGSRPLRLTVNFTMIDDDSAFVPEPISSALAPQIDQFLQVTEFEKGRDALDAFKPYDIALRSGLVFAWALKSMSDRFELKQVALENMLVQWKILGRLRASQKDYEVFVTIGSAMSEMPSYEKFYAALNDGIAASDIVYFSGHSGVGKNLSENRIQDKVVSLYSTLPAEQVPSHQLVVLMTCYSLHYFPLKGFPMPSGKAFERDVLYTASTPSGYDSRMLTGLVEQIDRTLAGGRTVAFEQWPRYYNGDVVLFHENQRHSGSTAAPSGER
ncbi:hypothetical protein [Bdellovibrio sp. HCB2-146]|uniref:hypothetical protein n=1 Tax=Bdellovibrio sp. HCB2-146 TaxID=3394362 RepID=UPI0039BCA8EE